MSRLFKLLFSICLYCFCADAFEGLNLVEQKIIEPIQKKLAAFKTLKAKFTQSDSKGKKLSGMLFISRPGQLRFEYKDPSPFLLLSDGKKLIYEDQGTKKPFFLSLETYPLPLLLKQNFSFDKIIKKINFLPHDLYYQMKIEDHASNSIILFFDKKTYMIAGWNLIDPQGNEILLILEDVVLDQPLKSDLFLYEQKSRALEKRKKIKYS